MEGILSRHNKISVTDDGSIHELINFIKKFHHSILNTFKQPISHYEYIYKRAVLKTLSLNIFLQLTITKRKV